MSALDEQFGVTAAGSTVEGEIRAGVTTFLTMAYILVVNPSMLSNFGATGIPFGDALFATAVAAFVGCIVMGLWANLPFALAPGMGLNAYFTFAVVLGMGIPWDVALAAVFVEGLLFLALQRSGFTLQDLWNAVRATHPQPPPSVALPPERRPAHFGVRRYRFSSDDFPS